MFIHLLTISALFGGSWLPGTVSASASPPPVLNASSGKAERQWLNGSDRESRDVYRLNVPEGWTVDDPASTLPGVILRNGKAVCGVHPVSLPKGQTLQLFHPFFSATLAAKLIQLGIAKEVVAHRPVRLSSGLMAIEQDVVLHQGGMSMELYVVHRDMGYILICETEARFWPAHREMFQRILRSFQVERRGS